MVTADLLRTEESYLRLAHRLTQQARKARTRGDTREQRYFDTRAREYRYLAKKVRIDTL